MRSSHGNQKMKKLQIQNGKQKERVSPGKKSSAGKGEQNCNIENNEREKERKIMHSCN